MSQIGDQRKSEVTMALADCPVAAKAQDFAQALATHQRKDEEFFSPNRLEGSELDATSDELDAAWGRIAELQDETMDLCPTSPLGLAIQVALAVDELVQLETMVFEIGEREERFQRVRRVLRDVLQTFCPVEVARLGLVEFFVSRGLSEKLTAVPPGPKPS